MPSKIRKKRPRKKKQVEQEMFDFTLNFDDPLMQEAEGVFERVGELMMAPVLITKVWTRKGIKEIFGPATTDEWCLKSRLHIVSALGEGLFVLNLFWDGRIYIIGYAGNTTDAYYNPDVRCFTQWCIRAGWKIPQPTADVVKESPAFWKHMWETMLVDCDYLDDRFGIRKSLEMREQRDDGVDEEDEGAE